MVCDAEAVYPAQVKRGSDQAGASQECIRDGPSEHGDLFRYIARYMTVVPVAASRFRGATLSQFRCGHYTQSTGSAGENFRLGQAELS